MTLYRLRRRTTLSRGITSLLRGCGEEITRIRYWNRLDPFNWFIKTARAEKQIPQGLLALDESWYNQQHDFELELEVTEAESGKQAFQTLMADLNIPITLAPNKIQRMMRTTAP